MDSGWACGWRNLQMLTSSLIQRSEAHAERLFGGLRAAPNVVALQAWLERAWDLG